MNDGEKGPDHLEKSRDWLSQGYRAAFQQSRDAIIFLVKAGDDVEEEFRHCNPATLTLFRVPDVTTFATLHPADLSPPYQPDGRPSREAAAAHIDEALQAGQAFFEWRHRTWDGVEFPAEVMLSRIGLTDGPILQAVVRDISERKVLENRLRESEANYRNLVEQHHELLVHRYLPDTTELFVNGAFAAFFGREPEDCVGQRWADFGLPQADQEAVLAHLATYSSEYSWGQHENAAIDAQGRRRWTRWSNQAFFDEEGRIQYFQAVGFDITERKEAEAEIELRQRAEGEAMIHAISTEVLAAPSDRIDVTIEDALARIGQATEAERSLLFQLANDGHTMSNTHEWTGAGVTAQSQALQELPTADFPWLLDQLRHKAVLPFRSLADIPDPGLRSHLARQGIRSLLLIPMFQKEGLIGFLRLDAVGGKRAWSDSEQHLLRVAADTLAGALARQRLEMELRYQARHDPLTGLLNRRPFEEALARETQRAQRYGHPFALIMLDVDQFKAVNDAYGHEVGDRILEALADGVSERLREPDLLARWGGEEFMALLPETDSGGAHRLAEAIRHRVAGQEFPGVGHLTVSLGVVEYRAHETIRDVTRRVDEALYAAKEGGRNRVVVDGEGPSAEARRLAR